MAIAIDSQMSSNAGIGGTTSPLSFSFTNTAGTLLIAGIIVSNGGSGLSGIDTKLTAAPTYNSVSMTLLTSLAFDLASTHPNSQMYVYYYISPATGSNTFSASAQWNSPGTQRIIAGLVSLTGAEIAGTTFGTPATSSIEGGGGSSVSTDVTSTVSGSLIMDLIGTGTSVTAPVAGQTTTWLLNHTTNTAADNGAMSTKSSGGGTVSMGWTTGVDWIHHIAFEIFASSAAATSLPPYYNPMAALIGR